VKQNGVKGRQGVRSDGLVCGSRGWGEAEWGRAALLRTGLVQLTSTAVRGAWAGCVEVGSGVVEVQAGWHVTRGGVTRPRQGSVAGVIGAGASVGLIGVWTGALIRVQWSGSISVPVTVLSAGGAVRS